MADKVAFELVSPDRLLMSVEADAVAMPGMEGDFGVLPGHAPLMSALRAGVIEVEGASDGPDRVYIAGGFAEVAADRLVVLAEEAVAVADMDRADIEQRIQDANEELSNAEEGEQRRLAEGKVGVLQEMLGAAR
ncbi:MAG: F0F1 ATP synthase subunit epsilon [Rhodospirillaceae bacterium]|jgi:F-type H+-transporting ATPase subunit epsilon|nr:F0F1 ATP synthase subunit epsilon [Rhodospirillaceae bacterium]MBT5195522.1 F0F1 ATP synthase subunit epsilon [Rhodospirillaceae bacterium]MBT5899075.1 F0F1 ATP synthase subunit epsilon [Rhodospirillaceae bacterium]MBT6428140.1 F0F1 ATP synthase subunit epsilon [Rhodospirillaceae bacterium]